MTYKSKKQMSPEIKKTSVIILRKIPYKETSLIASSLSPDYGHLGFMFRGELKVTKNKSPIVDLFRELEIEFKDKGSELITPSSVELLNSYDNISLYPKQFAKICKMANFIMKNSYSNVACKEIYAVFKNILNKASNNNEVLRSETLLKLSYLNENGLLLEFESTENNKQQKFINTLLKYSKGNIENLPDIKEEFWRKFNSWILNLCQFHHLKI